MARNLTEGPMPRIRLGADAIWWSFPLGAAVSASLGIAYYRFGGWRQARFAVEDVPATGTAADTGVSIPAMDREPLYEAAPAAGEPLPVS